MNQISADSGIDQSHSLRSETALAPSRNSNRLTLCPLHIGTALALPGFPYTDLQIGHRKAPTLAPASSLAYVLSGWLHNQTARSGRADYGGPLCIERGIRLARALAPSWNGNRLTLCPLHIGTALAHPGLPYTDLQIGHGKAPFLLSLLLQDPRCVKTREIGAMHGGGVVAVGMLPREIDLPLRIRKVVVHL